MKHVPLNRSSIAIVRACLAAAFWLALCSRVSAFAADPAVAPGIETLLESRLDWIGGQRLGLITNRTGVDRRQRSSIDLLAEHPQANLVALFCPEHGIRSEESAGKAIEDGIDEKTGLPVYSLYGATRRPTAEMLDRIDVLLYDIQDIGVRGYTYVSTLGYAMEAALAAGKRFIVLDRPDPLGGRMLDGPVTAPELISFLFAYETPWVYGMTPGEIARWIYSAKGLKGDLRVAPLKDWKRGMRYEETGLAWIAPSPCVPRPETCLYYAITGAIGELGEISEGVGTAWPFELAGAPWIDGEALAAELEKLRLPGVRFAALEFTPQGYSFDGQHCKGVKIEATDWQAIEPSRVMIGIVQAIHRLHRPIFPDTPFAAAPAKVRTFDRVLGCPVFRSSILGGADAEQLLAGWAAERERFAASRRAALLYD